MRACSFPITPTCRPGRPSFWWRACFTPLRCCSGAWAGWCGSRFRSAISRPEHDPEKWAPVFGKDHAPEKSVSMTTRRVLLMMALAALIATPIAAQDARPHKLNAVATTSIIADFVRNVGGDRVEVRALVRANSDAHIYAPRPGDAK